MRLKICNLSKTYPDGTRALDKINFEIAEGVFGLLGLNGAGKTTLMRILATLLEPSEGSFVIEGLGINKKEEIRNILGYLPQQFGLYPELNCIEFLDYMALLLGFKEKKYRKTKVSETIELVGLSSVAHKKLKTYSGGMKQRVGIAQAIINDPKILIVDEPTAGLDPEERIRFRNLLTDISFGKIIILSTHIVGDVNGCNEVAIINQGSLVVRENPLQLVESIRGKVYEIKAAKKEYDSLKDRINIISLNRSRSDLTIRFLNEAGNPPGAVPVIVYPLNLSLNPGLTDGILILSKFSLLGLGLALIGIFLTRIEKPEWIV